jgi:hypothetical protein
MPDAISESLARFQDLSNWGKVVDNVPILIEDTQTFPDLAKPGKTKTIKITRADLDRSAAHINKRLFESGNVIRLSRGHLKRKTTEDGRIVLEDQDKQPPVYGYGYGAHVGPFGPKGKMAVLTRAFYNRDHWEDAKGYPERSPEYWEKTGEIDAVALLKTAPKLDMGSLILCGQEGNYCFAQGVEGALLMGDPTEPPDAKAKPGPGKGAGDTSAEGGEGECPEGIPPEYAKAFHCMMKSCYPKAYSEADKKTKDGDDDQGAAGGPEAEKKVHMSKEDMPALYAKLEAQSAAFDTKLKKLDKDECLSYVNRLVAAGKNIDEKRAAKYVLMFEKTPEADRPELFALYLETLADDPTVEHARAELVDPAKVRLYGYGASVGPPVSLPERQEAAKAAAGIEPDTMTPEEGEEVQLYMREHDAEMQKLGPDDGFEKAKAAIMGKRKKKTA